ncbi:MAG: hypothetical protein EPN86_01935 [Nanoarchaeota archaeon]|nr:MAG: hypothetical protein EPN86_01935 [Nanoarchaeota archaeon]
MRRKSIRGEETVTEVDGLVIKTMLFDHREGDVDIVAGKDPIQVWNSIQDISPKGPKNKFIERHALDLWWLRTKGGYQGVDDGFFERRVGRHFGSVAYRAAYKNETIEDAVSSSEGIVSSREGILRYEMLLGSINTFGAVYFPTRYIDVKGEQFVQDPEKELTDFIMGQTAELRSQLKDNYDIYTYFSPQTDGQLLQMYVRFGIGPAQDKAEKIHGDLARIVKDALPAFQHLPYRPPAFQRLPG